jgi:poly(3-hydroxybutyrate) depolymerase
VNPRTARVALIRSAPGAGLIESDAGRPLGSSDLRRLLADPEGAPDPSAGTSVVGLEFAGRTTTMTVHIPPGLPPRPGVMIVLHGAGGSGAAMLPFFAGLGERLGMAVLCPDAQFLDDVAGRLEVSGLFAKRFRHPRWAFTADDFPMAAMRWALARLDADPDRCALVGISMGGLACWNLAMRLWPHFAAAVPLNGALSIFEFFGSDQRTRFLLANALGLPLFVVHGAADQRIPPRFDRASVEQLREAGHRNLTYVEVAGGDHPLGSLSFEDDGPLVGRLESWLRDLRRPANPRSLRHRALDDRHGRAHWIGMGSIDPAGAEVIAERVRDDAFRVDVRGARSVRLYLTADHLEPGQPLTVTVNDRSHVVRFKPDVQTVASTFQEHFDPALTAESVVTLPVDDDPQPGHREYPEELPTPCSHVLRSAQR